jgi:hypothetical protein
MEHNIEDTDCIIRDLGFLYGFLHLLFHISIIYYGVGLSILLVKSQFTRELFLHFFLYLFVKPYKLFTYLFSEPKEVMKGICSLLLLWTFWPFLIKMK